MPPKKKDEADIQTDKDISALEKRIAKEYQKAYEELKKKYEKFLSTNPAKKVEKAYKQYEKGKISQDEYSKILLTYTATNDKFKTMLDQLAEDLVTIDLKATSIAKSYVSGAFALNHAWGIYEIEKGTNIKTTFNLYNVGAMKYLFKKYKLLPDPKVDIPKDLKWNRQHLNSAVTQGILQGDDLVSIAKRFQQVTDMDRRAAIRNARTAMTGAQNGGRLFAWQEARSLGIKVNKQWLATLDNHTRDSHARLDGESVPLNKKFSNGLQYPGDAYGTDPSEIYNCRCTMVPELLDYPDDNSVQRYDNIEGKTIKNMSFSKWKEMKAKQAQSGDLVKNLDDANMKLDLLKAKMANMGTDKVFSGIWKDDVTYADYESKKDSIQAKRDYFEQKIKKIEDELGGRPDFSACGGEELAQLLSKANSYAWKTKSVDDMFWSFKDEDRTLIKELAKANGVTTRDALNAYKAMIEKNSFQINSWLEFTRLEKELELFEKKGAEFSKYFSEKSQLELMIKNLKAELKKANGFMSQFDDNDYTEDAKLMAMKFSSRERADKYFRPLLDEQWDDLTDYEKYALWQYTAGSGGFNRPLSGYNGSWSRSDFVGFDKADWGYENRSSFWPPSGFEGLDDKLRYDKAISALTLGIDKCTFEDNCWLVRGSDTNGLAGLLEGNLFSFKDAQKLISMGTGEMKKALVGQEFQCQSFLSTAIASGSGFGGGVKYNIYCPKGTHAIYAEPQSNYGNTSSGEKYVKGKRYSSVGGEAEMLIQRGTTFRITNIEKDWGGYTVDMEIVDQPDYFETGWEYTYNNGSTSYNFKP